MELAVKDSQHKILIVDTELRGSISADISTLKSAGITVLFWDEFSAILKTFPTTRPSKNYRKDSLERDPFLFIFTSGTTGQSNIWLLLLELLLLLLWLLLLGYIIAY